MALFYSQTRGYMINQLIPLLHLLINKMNIFPLFASVTIHHFPIICFSNYSPFFHYLLQSLFTIFPLFASVTIHHFPIICFSHYPPFSHYLLQSLFTIFPLFASVTIHHFPIICFSHYPPFSHYLLQSLFTIFPLFASVTIQTPQTAPVTAPRDVSGGGGKVGTLTISWDVSTSEP